MCWSAKISLLAFVLGTIFNFNLFFNLKNNINILAIILIWQFILLMQLFEFFAWSDQNCGLLNKFGTYGAFFANILQPLAVFIICFILLFKFNSNNVFRFIIPLLFLFAYCTYVLYNFISKKLVINCLTPTSECSHFQYKWWDLLPYGGYFYIASILASILCFIKPLSIALFQVIYILLTLFASMLFYNCGTPSLWCFYAAFAPLFTYFFIKYIN